MKASINNFQVDLSKPIDISLDLSNSNQNPIAWYLDAPKIEPVVSENFIGSVAKGAATNFNTITFNPHAHGTHTECLGHITKDFYSINKTLKQFFFIAELISITPEKLNEDFIISKEQLIPFIEKKEALDALIIRTLPNNKSKKSQNYSNTNPPYLTEEAAIFIRESGIKHLLIDLPSIDKEVDGGTLLAHKAFWNVKNTHKVNPDARFDATITELIFVENDILDGRYLLNIQIASFENDATPSKPIIYEITD
jgi:kynurenine formamidase